MISRKIKYLIRTNQFFLWKDRLLGKNKVFCVGQNKTGTTSLEKALIGLGYKLGKQSQGELFLDSWARRDFSEIIKFCNSAEAFQDVPFSLNYTYQALDVAFPGSKFILTVRKNSDEWYDSIVKYHSLFFGGGEAPTESVLSNANYAYKGWALRYMKLVYDGPDYNKERLVDLYEHHNRAVVDYFKHRPKDLLVLDVAEDDAYEKLCSFLGKPLVSASFPWENKTN